MHILSPSKNNLAAIEKTLQFAFIQGLKLGSFHTPILSQQFSMTEFPKEPLL
jgi:hypothetical protein